MQPAVEWFSWDGAGHPITGAPEPKRRFIESKWENKKVLISQHLLVYFARRKDSRKSDLYLDIGNNKKISVNLLKREDNDDVLRR